MTAPKVYSRPPVTSSASSTDESERSSCGVATTASQPSARYMVNPTRDQRSSRRTVMRIPTAAPVQAIARSVIPHAGRKASRVIGV